jgi:hypothetical protein
VHVYVCIDVNDILVATASVADAHALECWLEIGLAVVSTPDAGAGAAIGVALLDIRDGAGLDLGHDSQDGEDCQSGEGFGYEHFSEFGWADGKRYGCLSRRSADVYGCFIYFVNEDI